MLLLIVVLIICGIVLAMVQMEPRVKTLLVIVLVVLTIAVLLNYFGINLGNLGSFKR